MKKYLILTIAIASIILVLLYLGHFQKSPQTKVIVGGYVRYEAEETFQGVEPYELSAFGVLKPTTSNPEDFNQVFKIDLIDNKLILTDGLINLNGNVVITMSSSNILNIVSASESELIAKNETWNVIVTKKSVIITDKYGKGGNLVSGFVGDVELDLTSSP